MTCFAFRCLVMPATVSPLASISNISKQFIFNFEDKEYALEFTHRKVSEMEKRVFVASDITDKPMTTPPALFTGAFLAHHRYVKKYVIDKIYS